MRRQLTVWAALVPVVGVLAGAMFSGSSHAARGADLRSSVADLPDLIRSQTRQNEALTRQLGPLRSQVEGLAATSAPGDAAVARLTREANALAPGAGRTEVSGPGLSVSLTDSRLPVSQLPSTLSVDALVVHQQDVQAVVNALWRGGAESMMLMDQRVISTSAVRCVGNTLILQGRVYSPPFTISAIGDPARLQQALDTDPVITIYKEYVDAIGLGYEVKTSSRLRFPAYQGAISMSYAKVAQ